MVHALKITQPYFDDILKKGKSFEVRKDDRPFLVGDLVALNEWEPCESLYTGKYILAQISYILVDSEYVKDGYVILAIIPMTARLKDQF